MFVDWNKLKANGKVKKSPLYKKSERHGGVRRWIGKKRCYAKCTHIIIMKVYIIMHFTAHGCSQSSEHTWLLTGTLLRCPQESTWKCPVTCWYLAEVSVKSFKWLYLNNHIPFLLCTSNATEPDRPAVSVPSTSPLTATLKPNSRVWSTRLVHSSSVGATKHSKH